MRRNRVTEHNFPIQDQSQRCRWLLDFLIREEPRYSGFRIPNDQTGQERLLHDLLAVRPAGDPGEEFLRVQDAYLQNRFAEIGTPALEPVSQGPMIYIRRGILPPFPAAPRSTPPTGISQAAGACGPSLWIRPSRPARG